MGRTTKSGVTVRSKLAEGLPLVRGDRVELQQVMLNLILNAVEAMSGIDEGERNLCITTGKNASGDIHVSVRELGPGLAPEVRRTSSWPSKQRSRTVCGSGSRSADRLSRGPADACGRPPMRHAGRSFNPRCRLIRARTPR